MTSSNNPYRQVYISKAQRKTNSDKDDDTSISSFCEFQPTKVILKRPRTNLTKSFDSFDGYFQSNAYHDSGIQRVIQSALENSIDVLLWRYGMISDAVGEEECVLENNDLLQNVLMDIFHYKDDSSSSDVGTMSLLYSLSYAAVPGNETDCMYDCLAGAVEKSPLLSKVRQHEDGTFYMEGQIEVLVEDKLNAEFVLDKAKVGMQMIRENNCTVKRWHHLTEFTVYKEDADSGDMIVQKIQILNICPAERHKDSGTTKTKPVKNSKYHNKVARRVTRKEKSKEDRSLKAFHRIIDSLAQQNSHNPFRDSKLTRLIAKGMGSKVYNLAIVHVGNNEYDEVNAMMEFANKVKGITPCKKSELSGVIVTNRLKGINDSKHAVELLARKLGIDYEYDSVLVLKAADIQLDMDSSLDLVELQSALCRFESLQIDPVSILKRNSTEWFSFCN